MDARPNLTSFIALRPLLNTLQVFSMSASLALPKMRTAMGVLIRRHLTNSRTKTATSIQKPTKTASEGPYIWEMIELTREATTAGTTQNNDVIAKIITTNFVFIICA